MRTSTAHIPRAKSLRLHEIKFDGYRVIARNDDPQVRVWARTTSDYSKAFTRNYVWGKSWRCDIDWLKKQSDRDGFGSASKQRVRPAAFDALKLATEGFQIAPPASTPDGKIASVRSLTWMPDAMAWAALPGGPWIAGPDVAAFQ